jgi:AsmA protein
MMEAGLMNKLLKLVLVVIGFVVVLLVVAAVVLPMVVDPNDYKDEISASVLKDTGRELTIGGEIKWTVFPSLGLGLSDVTLGNRSGFGDQPMMDIGEAGASVKLMPLFKRRVEVGELKLSDVEINLIRKADGQTNWQDFTRAQAQAKTTSSAESDGFDKFVISGVQISNASVTFNDADEITELKEFELNASNIELGRPFDLKGGFSLNLAAQQLAGEAKFGGRVQSTANGTRLGIEGFEFSFIGERGPAGEKLRLDLSVNADVDVDVTNSKATLSDFVLRLHDMNVTGALDVTAISTAPVYTGQLKVAEFNPKSLMQALGLEVPLTSESEALTRLQADMSFAGSSNSADMRDLTLGFDQSTFKGRLKVDNFDSPKLAFDFEVDQLNIDGYMPPMESGDAPESTPKSASETVPVSAPGTVETDLSVEVFRGFTGGGDFRIGTLLVNGLTVTDVSLKMSSDGKGVRFFPAKASLYGGQHEGDIKIDASGERPILMAEHGVTGVQTERLLQDLAGTSRLQGEGEFSLKIRTDLSNSDTVLQSLSGNLAVSVLNGAILGIDVVDTIGAAKALLGKQDEIASETDDSKKTEFAELSMSGIFDRGVLSSDDLVMQSPVLEATGEGTFDLVRESIDYVLSPVLSDAAGGQSLGKLSGVPIPIRLTGNLYEPDYMIDILAVVIGSQKELINKKADDLISRALGGKVDPGDDSEKDGSDENVDAAKSLLKGLLGGKKKDKKKGDDGGG